MIEKATERQQNKSLIKQISIQLNLEKMVHLMFKYNYDLASCCVVWMMDVLFCTYIFKCDLKLFATYQKKGACDPFRLSLNHDLISCREEKKEVDLIYKKSHYVFKMCFISFTCSAYFKENFGNIPSLVTHQKLSE